MNSLSWFLYLADVVGNLSGAIVAIAIILIISSLFGAFFYVAANERKPPMYFAWCFTGASAMLFLASFLPSKNTMYAIAASELGQKAVESELGGKALKAVEQWIEGQVKK